MMHPSELALERYGLGELAAAERETIARHVAECGPCREQLAALGADDARFAAELGKGPSMARAIDAILAEAAPRRRAQRWRRAALGAGVMAMAAGLAFALWPARPKDSSDGDDFDGRGKGGAAGGALRLEVVRRSPDGAQDWIASGQRVSPGDAIRFRVSAPVAGYVGVIGIDAAGVVSAYAPAGPQLEAIAAQAPTTLDGSIVLDATLGTERLVAVVCPSPREMAELRTAALLALVNAGGDPKAVGKLTVDCQEHALLLDKGAR